MMHPPRLAVLLGLSLSVAVSGTAAAQNAFESNANKNLRPSGASALLPPGPASITQSTNPTSVITNSIACTETATGFHTPNFFYRAFTLSAFNPPLDSVQFAVQSVTYGIEQATAGPAGTQPMTVRVYDSSTNPPTVASLGTALASQPMTIANQTLSLITATFTTPPVALLNASDTLAVELDVPDGRAPLNNTLFVGSNNLGQTGPSFIRAPDCGVAAITNLTAIPPGVNMHLVMTVSGNNQVPVELQSFDIR
jgi:hypothetical protein